MVIRSLPVLFLLLAAPGCFRPEMVPEVPEISFVSFDLKKQTDELGNNILTGTLILWFRDGDGDIGLHAPDSIPENDTTYYNLFFTLYEKDQGDYIRIDNKDLPSPLYYRIPYMEPEGQNKTLSGDIEVEFEYLTIEYDTIRYKFFIIDRAGHISNTDSTADISFTEWKKRI